MSHLDDQFIKPVRNLLEEVEAATGKPVEFEVEKVEKNRRTRIAWVDVAGYLDRVHTLHYLVELTDCRQYLAAHECLHILRVWNAKPEERKVLEASVSELDTAYRDLFGVKNRFFVGKATAINDYTVVDNTLAIRKVSPVRALYDTFFPILNSLQSSVRDLWVDEEIQRRFHATEIEDQQTEFFKEARQHLHREINAKRKAKVTPLAFEIDNATNYAFYRLHCSKYVDAEDIIERDFSLHPEIIRQGERLVALTRMSQRNTYSDETRLVDKWALSLGILNWYHWKFL